MIVIKQDNVILKFKIDSNLTKNEKQNIVFGIINEINDRMMYVTEATINDEIIFQNIIKESDTNE